MLQMCEVLYLSVVIQMVVDSGTRSHHTTQRGDNTNEEGRQISAIVVFGDVGTQSAMRITVLTVVVYKILNIRISHSLGALWRTTEAGIDSSI